MTLLDEENLKRLISKEYKLDNFKTDDFIQIVGDLLEHKELSPRIIGKIAVELSRRKESIPEFAKQLEEYTGKYVPVSSIKVAAWVERRLENISIPEDLEYYALKVIAGTKNPEKWFDKVNKEGLSSAQVVREIKGPQKKKLCPHCDAPQPAPTVCVVCGQSLNAKVKQS